ncbi:MAG: MFS transporter [Alphaproteobacteria bacterium]
MNLRSSAPAWLVGAAFLMTLSSVFGQTYFIAIFAPQLKSTFGLSDGGFGGLYTVSNVASAAVLLWAGKIADHYRIRWLAVLTLLALAAACAAMASVSAAWMLLPVLFALRLFGQGVPGHLAFTGIGRWYVRRRGRMISLAALGFPISEALAPMTAVALIAAVGWRETWFMAAAVLCAVSVPLVLFFLRNEPAHDQPSDDTDGEGAAERRHWTRAEVLRRPEFFVVLAGVVTPPFVMTGIIFHQAYLVEVKGWTLAWFAAWFPAYAGSSVLAALTTGWLVDRFDARTLLPLFLLPMAAGVLTLAFTDSPWAVPVFMVLGAATGGSAATLLGALWAELFGTRHLGAIRSAAFAAMVFASALAPGLIGALLDMGVRLEDQYVVMAVYALCAAFWLKLLVPRLHRLAEA